jgi:hypothetical protein
MVLTARTAKEVNDFLRVFDFAHGEPHMPKRKQINEAPEAKGYRTWTLQKLEEVEELHLLLITIIDAVLEETPEFGDKLLEAFERKSAGVRESRTVSNVLAIIEGAIDQRRKRQ